MKHGDFPKNEHERMNIQIQEDEISNEYEGHLHIWGSNIGILGVVFKFYI